MTSRPTIPAGVWIALLAAGAAAIFIALWPIHRVVGQVYALAAIVIAFSGWTPLRRLVVGMPVPHRAVFFVLVAAMILGHFTFLAGPRRFFPFIPWEIFPFAVHVDPVEAHAFVGTTAQGRQVRLIPEQLFPSITQFDLPNAGQAALNEPLARALAAAYNQRHAADPVQQVDLFLLSQPLHAPADQPRAAPSCELLEHYDVSSARSN
jgi:hypothetical protein